MVSQPGQKASHLTAHFQSTIEKASALTSGQGDTRAAWGMTCGTAGSRDRVNAFRQFLKAMDEDETTGFTMPKGATGVFAECKAMRSADRITQMDLEQLKTVLAAMPCDTRLHVLLGLN